MEPFGLFSFLQSLLSSSAQEPAPSPAPTPQNEKEITPSIPQKEEISTEKNACADFLVAHEKRAGKIKK